MFIDSGGLILSRRSLLVQPARLVSPRALGFCMLPLAAFAGIKRLTLPVSFRSFSKPQTDMHSDQVTRYLLGQLPESEIQRLDALRTTDENFRQRVRIVEDDLIDCFSKGQLQGEDLMRFRRYFLASAINRERVKIAQGFLDDLHVTYDPLDQPEWLPAAWRTPAVLNTLAAVRKALAPMEAFWLSVRQPLLLGLWGASLILVIWGAFLAYEVIGLNKLNAELAKKNPAVEQATPTTPASSANDQLAQQIDQTREALGQLKTAAIRSESTPAPTASAQPDTASLQPASFSLRPASRGAEGVPELTVHSSTDEVLFQLELGRDDRASYRAELCAQPDGQRLWQSGTLKARAKDYGKSLEVKVPASQLKTRAYTLKVYGTNGSGTSEEALNYSFRINKQ